MLVIGGDWEYIDSGIGEIVADENVLAKGCVAWLEVGGVEARVDYFFKFFDGDVTVVDECN
jgi:hypothetical protein